MNSFKVLLLICATVAAANAYKCRPTGNTNVTANGDESRNGQFPHHVLVTSTFPEAKHYCSGALVNDKYVLTVAQCVQGASKVQVELGAVCLLDGGDNKFRYTFTALETFVKEGYNPETFENDVALVRFTDDKVRLPPWIKPLALPATDAEFLHEEVLTSGYGLLNYQTSTASDFLQFLKLRVISHELCQEEFSFVTPNSGRFCAQHLHQEPNCVSDVGSPLVFKEPGYKQYTLVGLTSFGQKFACAFGNAGALQEVRYHLEWIRSVTGEEKPTEAPEVTEQPEVTEEPEVTEQPEVTEEQPEVTEEPEVTEQPEVTEEPEVTEAPEGRHKRFSERVKIIHLPH